jgi:hypothetical protein
MSDPVCSSSQNVSRKTKISIKLTRDYGKLNDGVRLLANAMEKKKLKI